jgi:hypothetical protein
MCVYYYISVILSSWAPGVFYTYSYNHARRLRLEKVLYIGLPRISNGYFKPLLDPGGGFTSETAVRWFQKWNGRYVTVSEVRRLKIYNGYMQRPFPNRHKRPFGCNGHVTAMAVGQRQRLYSKMGCINLYSGVRMFTGNYLSSTPRALRCWGVQLERTTLTCKHASVFTLIIFVRRLLGLWHPGIKISLTLFWRSEFTSYRNKLLGSPVFRAGWEGGRRAQPVPLEIFN